LMSHRRDWLSSICGRKIEVNWFFFLRDEPKGIKGQHLPILHNSLAEAEHMHEEHVIPSHSATFLLTPIAKIRIVRIINASTVD